MTGHTRAGAEPVVAVVGATATGKSDLALDLAERLGGEVVNADAMQFYRGMDIGTAKLSHAERRGIRHHQLDVLDLVRGLCDDSGTTVVMVLHDLAMAARYADHLVAMRDGRVVAEGTPAEVVTPEVIEAVFGVAASVLTDPETGTPVVIPRRRQQ